MMRNKNKTTDANSSTVFICNEIFLMQRINTIMIFFSCVFVKIIILMSEILSLKRMHLFIMWFDRAEIFSSNEKRKPTRKH